MKIRWVVFLIPICSLMAAEREDDFKEQDRIFKHCQKVTHADKFEQNMLESCQKESEQIFLSKREKAKMKLKDKSNEDT